MGEGGAEGLRLTTAGSDPPLDRSTGFTLASITFEVVDAAYVIVLA